MARGLPASATIVVTFALLTHCLTSAAARADNVDNAVVQLQGSVVSDYPVGDPRRCQELARKNGYRVQTFEVLPGGGWDNLRNVEEGQVVHFNYSQCRTTQDGRFLLPNSVNAVPVKTSNVQTFAELISHWKDWTSTNSKSINVEAGLSLSKFSFSGKFSADFQDMKSKQIGDKSVSTRTQLRYIRYGVQLQPDTPLHPVFRDRVLDIAAAQELGQEERARYLSQLLVRDFGTHVVTKADAGASLEQVDQVREDWVKSHMEKKSDILASASASLFLVFHMSASYETKTDKTFTDDYQKSRTSSSIRTKGGPLFRPANFTPDSWAAEVDSDLVAMDRSGDPLYYVLTGATLPELPASTLNEVTDRVREAVETYYSYNAIPGCLDTTSPNFSPAANTEDGSCKPPPTNLTFGGVYQTCAMNPGYNNGDLCGNLRQVNPKTGTYSCPPKYREVTLHSGTTATSRSEHRCHGWWLWKRCHDDYYRSEATYTMKWCVATDGVPPRSGYLFGGLFTAQVANPVTQASSCPPAFFPLSMGSAVHLHVCISDDYEFGENYALPFAGFLSCQAGNPLAVSQQQSGSAQSRRKVRSADGPGGGQHQPSSLREFFKDEADDWPMRCPDGFSRHLATVDQGCQISYCVQTGSMRGPALTPVKRPPFMPTPPLPAPPSQNLVIFDPTTNTWKRNEQAQQMLTLNPSSATAKGMSSDDDEDGGGNGGRGMSPGTAAGISIAATLGCVLLTTGAVLAVRAKRRKGSSGYRRLEDPLLSPRRQSYGSGGDSGPAAAGGGAVLSVNLDGDDDSSQA